METAVKALGWNKNQLYELIQELDPNHYGDITYEEFVLIMKYIEQKQSQFPPIHNSR
jgi:Ca2+-binding EF-hand superfamily protein